MIYLLAGALILTFVGFYFRSRSNGPLSAFLDFIATALLGWIAGSLIGIGARIGMWSIPFFNGTESRFTPEGTLQVILLFSLFGIGLGLIYEFLFRGLLRGRGALFGLLITFVTVYPLAASAIQQLTFTPPVFPTIGLSLLFVGIMFLPFSIALELMLRQYHRVRDHKSFTPARIGN